MAKKPLLYGLLYGLIGFLIGGLVITIVATTINRAEQSQTNMSNAAMSSMSMDDMMKSLKDKTGDEFDSAFISGMIAHHEGAVEMAKLSATNAKRDEIKTLSVDIIAAQEKEITQMKQWQKEWGYATDVNHRMMGH